MEFCCNVARSRRLSPFKALRGVRAIAPALAMMTLMVVPEID
jgi:hypothetical protein